MNKVLIAGFLLISINLSHAFASTDPLVKLNHEFIEKLDSSSLPSYYKFQFDYIQKGFEILNQAEELESEEIAEYYKKIALGRLNDRFVENLGYLQKQFFKMKINFNEFSMYPLDQSVKLLEDMKTLLLTQYSKDFRQKKVLLKPWSGLRSVKVRMVHLRGKEAKEMYDFMSGKDSQNSEYSFNKTSNENLDKGAIQKIINQVSPLILKSWIVDRQRLETSSVSSTRYTSKNRTYDCSLETALVNIDKARIGEIFTEHDEYEILLEENGGATVLGSSHYCTIEKPFFFNKHNSQE